MGRRKGDRQRQVYIQDRKTIFAPILREIRPVQRMFNRYYQHVRSPMVEGIIELDDDEYEQAIQMREDTIDRYKTFDMFSTTSRIIKPNQLTEKSKVLRKFSRDRKPRKLKEYFLGHNWMNYEIKKKLADEWNKTHKRRITVE